MNNPQDASSKGYRPVSSNFHDELAAASAQKQTCEIAYLDPQGQEQLVISPVYDLYAENGIDCVRLDKGSIPLDRITGVNGRRGNGETDEALLAKGLQANAAPATGHHKYLEEENRTGINQAETHQTEIHIQPRTDAHAAPAAHTAHHQEDDFVHRFLSSPAPFLVADNEWYELSADRLRHLLYFRAKRTWVDLRDMQELGGHFSRIAPLMGPEFTLLNDLTGITPDEEGTVWAPPMPNKDVLLRNGLVRVADLVAPACETLVHGMDAFSVNSVPLRYFKDRIPAEHWLIKEHVDNNSGQAASA